VKVRGRNQGGGGGGVDGGVGKFWGEVGGGGMEGIDR